MKKLLIVYMTCLVFVAFPQDIRGFYIYSSMDANMDYFVNVTLFTDASQHVNRPNVDVFLGFDFFPSDVFLPLITTTITNGIKLATYSNTNTINAIGANFNTSFTDTFWVGGIKNFSTSDKSRITVFDVMGDIDKLVDTQPEVTNLPASLSNFTVSGNQVLYNPASFDAEGDSISYDLENYYVYGNYYLPAGATINPLTGLFSFSKDSTDLGLYAFHINIREWRNDQGFIENIGTTQLGFVLTTNLTLGIKDLATTPSLLELYPNPTNGMLRFKPGTIKENEKLKLEISNALGEIVLQKNDFALTQNLDVSGLQQGIYFVSLSNDTRTFSNKFVKTEN